MKIKTISNLLTLALVFFTINALAQSTKKGNINGVVFDNDNLPLPGAEVFLKINDRTLGNITDFDGKFVITNIPAGEQTLTINYLGFIELKREITVEQGKTISLKNLILQPDVESLEDVVIKAKSSGQVRALNVQKNSENIINVISLEQASKFPDSNIGDALKRVSGLTIKTDQGEARNVSIRGLGSESTTMLINGDRISSTSFNSRNVEADLIPADVIQNIEVSKSASADLDGEATGGIVNLITRAAYSEKLKLSLTANYGYTPTWGKVNYNTALGVSQKILDGKLGIAFNGSINSRSYKSDDLEADWDWFDTGVIGDPTDDTRFLNDLQVRQYWIRRDRKNLNLGLDYEFSENFLIGMKASLSSRDDFENRFRTRYGSIDYPSSFTPEGIIVSEGSITSYTTTGSSDGKPKNARLDTKDLFNMKLYGEHLIGKIESEWSFTYSKSTKRRKRREISYRVPEGETNFFINIKNPNRPQVTTDLLDFDEEAVLNTFRRTIQNVDDENIKGKLKFEIPFKNGYLKSGFQYRRNNHDEDNRGFDIIQLGNSLNEFRNITTTNYRRHNFTFGNYSFLNSPDREFIGSLKIDNETQFSLVEDNALRATNSYNSIERISAGYLQAKYKFTDDISLRAGVRYERTEGDYTAFIFDQLTEENKDNKVKILYDNILPSADVKYEITKRLISRLAYSRTINRPSYSRIAPRIRFGGSDLDDERDIGRLTIGNPELRPRTSDNFDFSLEYYIPKGLISIGLFHKELTNFYGRINTNLTLTNGDVLQINRTENIGNASISGVEFAFQKDLDFLPSFLSNLSFYGNATLIESGLTITNPKFPGFSSSNFRSERNLTDTADFTYNTSLGYNAKKFTITASVNGTTAYIDSYGATPIQDEYYDKQIFLDINGSYDINKNLKVFLEAKNLTNQPLRYYIGESRFLLQEEYYESQFIIGFKYKL